MFLTLSKSLHLDRATGCLGGALHRKCYRTFPNTERLIHRSTNCKLNASLSSRSLALTDASPRPASSVPVRMLKLLRLRGCSGAAVLSGQVQRNLRKLITSWDFVAKSCNTQNSEETMTMPFIFCTESRLSSPWTKRNHGPAADASISSLL